ncbi:molybdopterin-synthase adenylyltransferase MoeB [Longimicrobium sp.]|uniref:molybdopterin-synthase adenylyltransferase MoeB n=1 Tax=Longimicrobium sp. TaxID=2029185 RepID=UPI002E3332A6|nr:molybdopterin-synthase adenylyltransferase MoeB [Longimicrobium sp.]HEX6037522.1 molybdopterin-synthase adenylyltransferase MoeB [Longimicrobium sp.]
MNTIDASELPALSTDESIRYSRHLILPEVGTEGQRRLKAGRVLLVGAGGLGSPSAMYLAAAGVGTLGIVDFDTVDTTNLQRQVIHGTSDVGRPKLDSARDRIAEINPHVVVEPHPVRLTSANAREIVRAYDVVIDGSDNFPTRYLVNDACVLEGRPCIYGSILRWEGQASVFWAGHGPCYRCLFAEPPPPGEVPSCAEAGVLGVLPGIIGCVQALEAVKLLLGQGDALIGRLLLFDALRMRFREMRLRRDPQCPVCGDAPTVRELIDYERFCGYTPADATPETHMSDAIPEMTPTELKARLDRGDKLTIIDVREPFEWDIGNLEPQGARLIPLKQLPQRLGEIDPDEEIVMQCRSGARSAQAAGFLKQHGYERVWNLDGGILAWSDEVDSSIPKY